MPLLSAHLLFFFVYKEEKKQKKKNFLSAKLRFAHEFSSLRRTWFRHQQAARVTASTAAIQGFSFIGSTLLFSAKRPQDRSTIL